MSLPPHSLLPVSVIVLTYNEENSIRACLESVRNWAAEIFVLDSYSTDKTLEVARQYTDKIFSHHFENYSNQRNWSLDNLPISNEWVFHIDADERVSSQLAVSIEELLHNPQIEKTQGALVARRTIFMGRAILHGGHYPVYHARLFRRHNGRCEDRLYDQHFVVSGKLVVLSGDLIDEINSNLQSWTRRHSVWGELEAREALNLSTTKAGHTITGRLDGNSIEQRRWLRASVYQRGPLFIRAFAYFFYRYVLRLGFLDGVEGLIFHFLQGCWFRFYVDSIIWQLRHELPVSVQLQ